MENLKDTGVSFRPSSGNGELPQGGMSARGSRRTTASSRPRSRRSTRGELTSVKGGRRDTQESAAAVCSQHVAAALQAILLPTDAVAPPEDAALITTTPSLPTPCEETPQPQAEVLVEPEEEAPPALPHPELPKEEAVPSTSTTLIMYRAANTVVRVARPKSAVDEGSPADGEMVIKLIYQPYVDTVMGRSVRVTGTGTLTGRALARIAAEQNRRKHTVELVPGPEPWAVPQAAVKTAALCTALVPYQRTKPAAPTIASKPPSARSFMHKSPAETMVSLCILFQAEANSAAAKPFLFRDNFLFPGRSINVDAALAMLPVTGTGTLTGQELACIAAEHQTAKHTVELVPGKGPGPWAPAAKPHAAVEAPAACTAVVPYQGNKPAALTVASTPPSAQSFMCTSPAETMVSLCNRFVAEANSTAAKPYLFRDNISLPGRSINVDAALAMLPGVHAEPPAPEKHPAPCMALIVYQGSNAAAQLESRAQHPQPGSSSLTIEHEGYAETMPSTRGLHAAAMPSCCSRAAPDDSTAVIPYRPCEEVVVAAALQAAVDATLLAMPPISDVKQPASTRPFTGQFRHMLWLQKKKKKKSVYRSPSISVDWGAKGRLSWKLWAFKQARRARGGEGKAVDWGAPGRPNPALWPRKRAVFKAPSIAVDWGAVSRPNPALWPGKRPVFQAPSIAVDWSAVSRPNPALWPGKRPVFQAPSIAVDWGAVSRPNSALWPRKRAVFQAPSIAVDWSAVSCPNPALWPRKRPVFQAPSIAVDWSASEVPACWLWEQKVAVRGLGEDAPDAVDWSGAGVPAVISSMACQQRLAAVGLILLALLSQVSRKLQGLFGQIGRACACFILQ